MAKRKAAGKTPRKPVLWLHPSGYWTKKFQGRNYYFGKDEEEAVRRFAAEWDNIRAGIPVAVETKGPTVKDLVNTFLHAKRQQVTSGELSPRMWSEYLRMGEEVVAEFGGGRSAATLRPADFGRLRATLAARLGPFALAKSIQLTRTIFAFAFENDLIPAPVRYGTSFDKPSVRLMRLERAKRGPKLLEAAEVWKLLDRADVQMQAMILLGLNAAYGQSDLSALNRRDLRARPGWLEAPRQKTGIPRRAKLWPETIEALAAVAKMRPKAKNPEDAGAVFITYKGFRWVKFADRGPERAGVRNDSLGYAFTKLARKAKVRQTGFYVLRHTFQTVADGARDLLAVQVVMGHRDASISGHYRERIEDDRIEAVCNHVRDWLLAGKPKGKGRWK